MSDLGDLLQELRARNLPADIIAETIAAYTEPQPVLRQQPRAGQNDGNPRLPSDDLPPPPSPALSLGLTATETDHILVPPSASRPTVSQQVNNPPSIQTAITGGQPLWPQGLAGAIQQARPSSSAVSAAGAAQIKATIERRVTPPPSTWPMRERAVPTNNFVFVHKSEKVEVSGTTAQQSTAPTSTETTAETSTISTTSPPAATPAPKPSNSGGGGVLGNQSVHTTGVLGTYRWMQYADIPPPGPSLLIGLATYIARTPAVVFWCDEKKGFVVQSPLSRSTTDGTAPAIFVPGVIAATFDGDPTKYLTTNIILGNPIPLGHQDTAVFEPFMVGGLPSARILNAVLSPIFQFNDKSVAPILADNLTAGITRYDCIALYAKLWYLCLGLGVLEAHHLDLADLNGWQNEPNVTSLTGNDACEQANALVGRLREGNMAFVEHKHVNVADSQYLWWLANGGQFFLPVEKKRAFPFQTVVWPAYQVEFILTTSKFPIPNVQLNRPDTAGLRAFIMRIALLRAEQDDCMRGLYFASDLIASNTVPYHLRGFGHTSRNKDEAGVPDIDVDQHLEQLQQLTDVEESAGQGAAKVILDPDCSGCVRIPPHQSGEPWHTWPARKKPTAPGGHEVRVLVTPHHECFGQLVIARPNDINVFLRLVCDIKSEADPAKLQEYEFLSRFSTQDLVLAILAGGMITSTMTTTFCYSLNMTSLLLQRILWPLQMPPSYANIICTSNLFSHRTTAAITDIPEIYQHIYSMMLDTCGFSRPLDYLINRNWGSGAPNLPDVIEPFNDGMAREHPAWPYTWASPLCIDRWVKLRPLEWGICEPIPRCTFASDIVYRAPGPLLGWSAYLGDNRYIDLCRNRTPFALTAYAAYAINIICQHFNWQEAPCLSEQRSLISFLSNTQFDLPKPMIYQPPYHPGLNVFQPCTIMSFDAFDPSVISPMIPIDKFPNGMKDLLRLATYKNYPVPNTGLVLTDYEDATHVDTAFDLPPALQPKRAASVSSATLGTPQAKMVVRREMY